MRFGGQFFYYIVIMRMGELGVGTARECARILDLRIGLREGIVDCGYDTL